MQHVKFENQLTKLYGKVEAPNRTPVARYCPQAAEPVVQTYGTTTPVKQVV